MNTHMGLIAKKLGNSQVFEEDGTVRRVTVVEAGPCTVLGKRTKDRDGYAALQLGFGQRADKHVNKPAAGFYKKNGQSPAAIIKEFRLPQDTIDRFEVGQVIRPSEVFAAGQFVDVYAKSKGKGFTGVMKRHNFSGAGTVGHGTHEAKRHGGSIGMNMTPGRTLPGQKMPGQHGDAQTCIQNLKVVKVIDEDDLVLLEGSVPGARHGTVEVRWSVKKPTPEWPEPAASDAAQEADTGEA